MPDIDRKDLLVIIPSSFNERYLSTDNLFEFLVDYVVMPYNTPSPLGPGLSRRVPTVRGYYTTMHDDIDVVLERNPMTTSRLPMAPTLSSTDDLDAPRPLASHMVRDGDWRPPRFEDYLNRDRHRNPPGWND